MDALIWVAMKNQLYILPNQHINNKKVKKMSVQTQHYVGPPLTNHESWM